MSHPARCWQWLPTLSAMLFLTPAMAELPPEDSCPTISGGPNSRGKVDASPTLLREGMILGADDVLALRDLLPSEIWGNREQFFHEGMRLEIGPCHRRYPTAEFFAAATREFAGIARVDADGNLLDYVAGVPFPPDSIDPEDKDAAVRWAWNLAYRYRGGGPEGRFRIVDLPSAMGRAMTYEGRYFFIQTGHRADLPKTNYQLPFAAKTSFVAGGQFDKPQSARHLAWNQQRRLAADQDHDLSDDTFVYVPTMRKARRAATSYVDGMYTPRYRVSGDSGGGGFGGIGSSGSPYGVGSGSGAGTLNPSSADSIAQTENLQRGFGDLVLRPNAYLWRMRGQQVVLAPINATRSGFPVSTSRNFGPSGISVGNDRWDVRYAVLIEGAVRERGGEFDHVLIYVDYQTQQPLYIIQRRGRGRLVEIIVPVHRFSGDVFGYPKWPNGARTYVFDPVAAVAYTVLDGSGWRRESYGTRSVPRGNDKIRRYLSTAYLTRGR